MKLLVNAPALIRSSRGVKRYTSNVLNHLLWPGEIEFLKNPKFSALGRFYETFLPVDDSTILWSPCKRGSLLAQHHVVTIHDCINIEYTYAGDKRLLFYHILMQPILSRAEVIVAISYATRNAILRNYRLSPDKIVVIPSGVDPIGTTSALPNNNTSRPFVLLVTNSLPHKNTIATCSAWVRSIGPSEGIELRVIGSLPDTARNICEQSGIPLSLQIDITDRTLVYNYKQCLFLLAPSLCEGHDLPVAEALSLGAEVLCSDIDVHREFYDGRVMFFDPCNEDSIVVALNQSILRSKPWFEQPKVFAARGFNDVASDYADLFLRIAMN